MDREEYAVVAAMFRDNQILEYQGMSPEAPSLDPERIKKASDTLVFPQMGKFFVYFAVPRAENLGAAITANEFDWQINAERALASYLALQTGQTPRLIRDHDGKTRELGKPN